MSSAPCCHDQTAQTGPSGLRLHQRSRPTEAPRRTYVDEPSTVHMDTTNMRNDCPYEVWRRNPPAWNGSRRWVCTVKDHAWQPFRPYGQTDILTNHACKHEGNQSGSAVPERRPRTVKQGRRCSTCTSGRCLSAADCAPVTFATWYDLRGSHDTDCRVKGPRRSCCQTGLTPVPFRGQLFCRYTSEVYNEILPCTHTQGSALWLSCYQYL
jgi:hypothetical protein